jgi:hypothetical protein
MDPVQAFQIILMAQMRNSADVAAAMSHMGFDESALSMAQLMIGRVNLITIMLGPHGEHPFLGVPLRAEPALGPETCRAKVFYQLPLWQEFELEITIAQTIPIVNRKPLEATREEEALGDVELRRSAVVQAPQCQEEPPDGYRIVGMRFVRLQASRAMALEFKQIVPWHVVEDDLALICRKVIVLESWFPSRDLYCILRNPDGAEYALAFDFGLLQQVLPWKDLNVTLDESREIVPGRDPL